MRKASDRLPLDHLLGLDEEQLYTELGLIYLGPTAGIGDDLLGRLLSDARQEGEERFAGFMPAIKKCLCEQWHACEQRKKYEDEATLAMAIGDVLVTVLTSAPVITVSALIVKIGVKKFCDCP